MIALFVLMLLARPSFASDAPLPFFTPDDLTPYWMNEAGSTAKPSAPLTLGAFHVIDQESHAINEASFENHISLVNFFFAECPGLCPTMMNSIRHFQSTYPKANQGVRVYSFSVQPDHDKPLQLRRYAKTHRLSLKTWSLLTGEPDEIFHVGKGMLKADGSVGSQKSETSFIHTRNIYLIDGKRRLRGIYDSGSAEKMALLAQDIERLKHEHD